MSVLRYVCMYGVIDVTGELSSSVGTEKRMERGGVVLWCCCRITISDTEYAELEKPRCVWMIVGAMHTGTTLTARYRSKYLMYR
jgi:hypothetical protein